MPVALYRSKGLSMEPAILDGDELIVDTSPDQRFEPGDVLVFRAPDRTEPVAHRLLGPGPAPETLALRGDAAAGRGETVARAQVIGRVELLRRGGRLVPVRSPGRRGPAGLIEEALLVLLLHARLVSPDISVEPLGPPPHAAAIARVKGRRAAFLELTAHARRERVAWTSWVPERLRFRGAGIGARLLAAAEGHAAKAGCNALVVDFDAGDRAAEKLLRSRGYGPSSDPGAGPGRGLREKALAAS